MQSFQSYKTVNLCLGVMRALLVASYPWFKFSAMEKACLTDTFSSTAYATQMASVDYNLCAESG